MTASASSSLAPSLVEGNGAVTAAFDWPNGVVPLANWNGVESPLDQVRVSVLDRGFFFGDAVYEALRVYGGKAWLVDSHMKRLTRSLGELRIPADVSRIERRMLETIAHSGVTDGMTYLQVTRGEAPRSHQFPKTPAKPNELIYVVDFGGDPYAKVRSTGVAVASHPDLRWKRRDIKTTNLLGNCLAMQYAAEQGCFEAILVDDAGYVTEGSHTSAFAVKDGVIYAPPQGSHILPGCTRAFVLTLAEKLGVEYRLEAFKAADVFSMDELFLTGTSLEALAVTTFDGKPIGRGPTAGKPG
ncbi:MAG: aminotransferase class IV, partial [Planctomycetia bacterium]